MRGGNHMDNQLPELKVNMLGRFSITYGEPSRETRQPKQ